jgi:hypothetical protein
MSSFGDPRDAELVKELVEQERCTVHVGVDTFMY